MGKSFGNNEYKKCMEILVLVAIAFLTFSHFGGYYLIITTIGKHSKLLERIAYVLLMCKVCGTRYGKKDFFLLLTLGILSITTYRVSGNKEMMLNILAMAAIKDVELKKIFRVSLYSLIFTVLLVGGCSLLGLGGKVQITQMYGREGIETRYCFGFIHPNQWAHAMFMTLLLFAMGFWDVISWKHVLVMCLFNGSVYLLSASKTAFVAGLLLVMGLLVFKYAKRLTKNQIFKAGIVLGSMGIWWLPYLSIQETEFGHFLVRNLNKLFTGRFSIARNYYYYYGTSFWGMRIEDRHPKTNEVLDMGYIRYFMENGWIWYILFFVALVFLVLNAVKKQKDLVLVALICILFYTFSEYVAFSQVTANIIFYFIGDLLFEFASRKRSCRND